jgi:L-amino acid N-acyltransferase YncA
MTSFGDVDPNADSAARQPSTSATLIRAADDADLAAVRAIYAHHVETGTGSFEEVAPSVSEMVERRVMIVGRGLPYLIAERRGQVAGFAYAAPFRPRSAYRFTVEDSIYIHPDAIGQGVGRRLLSAVIDACHGLGYQQMIAVIGDSANAASIGLHAHFGFVEAGRLVAAGYKFGRWLDVVFMQRALIAPRRA